MIMKLSIIKVAQHQAPAERIAHLLRKITEGSIITKYLLSFTTSAKCSTGDFRCFAFIDFTAIF